ncbi:MAG: BON domain-containing protein [Gallionellaceae bacterium]|nr:BON domain-containing protein [Gallionellaceae bacterium]
MKSKLATSCFVIGCLLGPVIAHAEDADADRSRPMTFVKDSVITTKIKAKLAEEKMRTLLHIGVDTDSKGAVVLSGKARTQEAADKAIAIAQGTEGVTSVTSKIEVSNTDTDRVHPMTFVKDSIITTKIKAKLAKEKMRTLLHIGVDTDSKGTVVLSGNVRTQEVADKAIAIAQGTEGVTSVISKIKVKKDD